MERSKALRDVEYALCRRRRIDRMHVPWLKSWANIFLQAAGVLTKFLMYQYQNQWKENPQKGI